MDKEEIKRARKLLAKSDKLDGCDILINLETGVKIKKEGNVWIRTK